MRTYLISASCLACLVFIACQKPQTQAASQSSEADQTMQIPAATVKDLMLAIIDTNADVVWESVSSVSNEKGLVETRPQTDEDWQKVRRGAVALAEGANMLMIPGRRVARPGEKSETPGVELEPEEMDALIAKDPAAFHKRAADLRTAALEILDAVDKKDADKVFAIGEHIERACENCHSHYWYPNEKIPELVITHETDSNVSTPPATTAKN
jgi:cytochrome c556